MNNLLTNSAFIEVHKVSERNSDIKIIIGPKDDKRYEFQWENEFYEIYILSDIGLRRVNNEDKCLFAVNEYMDPERQILLLGVADGMGGAVAGEHASSLASQTITEEFFRSISSPIPENLISAISKANYLIYHLSETNPNFFGMGTTISLLSIAGDNAYIAQVGDSRVYLYREGFPLKQITEDHSIVAEQIREGLITEEEAQNHLLKNLITRALGIKETVEIDLYALYLQKGDTLLLCSDGLSNLLTKNELLDGLSKENLKEGLNDLLEIALIKGGQDNISEIGIRLKEIPPHFELCSSEKMSIVSVYSKPSLWQRIWKYFTGK